MKKSLVGVILTSVLLFGPNIVNAESSCSYSEQAELNNIAANVKTTYETVKVKTGTIIDVDASNEFETVYMDLIESGFDIYVLNVTEDIYVKVSNDKNDEVYTFRNSDTDGGVAKFQTTKTDEMVTYTIEIYANKYDCTGEIIRKYTMMTPMFNRYSELQVCADNPDFYYCQEFISTETISYESFYKKLNEYVEKVEVEEQKENEKNLWEKIKDFYHDNMIAINIAGTVIVIAGVTTTAILIKKRRSRVL